MRTRGKSVCGALFTLLLLSGTVAPAWSAETDSAMARGARLYDKWFAENKAAKPAADHPAYPVKGGKYGKDDVVALQGMPRLGLQGQGRRLRQGRPRHRHQGHQRRGGQGSGGHRRGAARQDPRLYRSAVERQGRERSGAVRVQGTGQPRQVRRRRPTRPRATAPRARPTSTRLCAGCHGIDGKKIKDGPPLGSVADNGAEMMHKVLNGQPGEAMPALRALDHADLPPTSRCT